MGTRAARPGAKGTMTIRRVARWAVAATALACPAMLLAGCGGEASPAAAPAQAVTVTATPAAAA